MSKKNPLKGKLPPKKKPKAPSRALVPAPRVTVHAHMPAPIPPPGALTVLDDDREIAGDAIVLGNLGMGDIKFTAEEEKVLSRSVDVKACRILPQRTPVVYLPHIEYTRWLNDAFGRAGWVLVPVGKPAFDGQQKCIVCPYVLYIRRVPVAAAWGQQEYHPSNKDQTYGDALESCFASGLRRCCKRIGMGLELWDREWIDAFIAQHGLFVTVKQGGEEKQVWRKKDGPPLWNEVSRGGGSSRRRDQEPREPETRTTRPADNPSGDQPISEQAAARLWEHARRANRDDNDVAEWLGEHFQIERTEQLKRKHYNYAIECLEADAPLPGGIYRG